VADDAVRVVPVEEHGQARADVRHVQHTRHGGHHQDAHRQERDQLHLVDVIEPCHLALRGTHTERGEIDEGRDVQQGGVLVGKPDVERQVECGDDLRGRGTRANNIEGETQQNDNVANQEEARGGDRATDGADECSFHLEATDDDLQLGREPTEEREHVPHVPHQRPVGQLVLAGGAAGGAVVLAVVVHAGEERVLLVDVVVRGAGLLPPVEPDQRQHRQGHQHL